MSTYNVLRVAAHQPELRPVPDVILEGEPEFVPALEEVIAEAYENHLVPLNAPDVALLVPYNVKQAWELRARDTGEKIALLAIQEVA